MKQFSLFSEVFPKRPLRLKPVLPKTSGLIFLFLFLTLSGIGILTWMYLSNIPGILKDWKISKDIVTVEDGRLRKGKCTTHNWIFVDCTATLSFRDSSGKTITEEQSFMFFDFHSGDYSAEIVRSASQPDLISTDLAINMLWSRITAVLIFSGLGLLLFLTGFIIPIKARARKRKISTMSGTILKPVFLNLLSQTTANGQTTLSCSYKHGGESKKVKENLIKASPFIIGLENDKPVILGVTDNQQSHIMLVDEDLSWIDLTETERLALFQAREKIFQMTSH